MVHRQGRLLSGLCAILLLCGGPAAQAGAFTLEEGQAKLFVSGLVTSGDHYFDGAGRLKSRGRWRKSDLQAFVEFGLTGRVTLFGSTALERIAAKDGTTSKREGLGRSEIGARAKLFRSGEWIGSVQTSVVIAGAKKSDGLAAIGETDDQFDIRGLIARSFEIVSKPAFIDLQAGYRARSGDPADEMRVDATFGIRPSPRLLLLLQSFNTIGTGAWKGPYPLRQRIHKAQAAALFDLTERLTIFGALFVTPIGRDALDERGGQIGLGWRF